MRIPAARCPGLRLLCSSRPTDTVLGGTVGPRADLRAERERVVRPLAPPEPALAVIPAAAPPGPPSARRRPTR